MSEDVLREKLHDVREELRELRHCLAAARRMRIAAVAALVAVAILYAWLFSRLERRPADDADRYVRALQAEWSKPETRQAADRAGTTIMQDVLPAYLGELQAKAEEAKLGPALAANAAALTGEALARLGPAAWDKATELNIRSQFADELGNLVTDVGPIYYNGVRELMRSEHLTEHYVEAARDVARTVGPVFLHQINRVAPDVMDQAQALERRFPQDVTAAVEDRVKAGLERGIAAGMERMRAQAGLGEEAARRKAAQVVLAAGAAAHNVVQRRPSAVPGLMADVHGLLDRVPQASERDPDRLLGEISRLSLYVMMMSLPEPEARYEGGKQ